MTHTPYFNSEDPPIHAKLIVKEQKQNWKRHQPRPKGPAGRFLKKIARHVGTAVSNYNLIEKNDSILVGFSGGKDSWTLLETCLHLRDKAPIDFRVAAIHLDLGLDKSLSPGTRHSSTHFQPIITYLQKLGVETYFLETDIGPCSKKMSVSTSPCFLCSRFRRGILYKVGLDLGFNKIALGHHADDLIETLLLNQFFSGQIKSMPPRLVSDDKKNIVIRPLCSVFESNISQYASLRKLPILPSSCEQCSATELPKRLWIKKWLKKLESQSPGLKGYLLSSLSHVRPSHLMDKGLFDFG